MKVKCLVSLLVLLSSCVFKKNQPLNLINIDDVEKAYIFNALKEDKAELNSNDLKLLIESVNKAKLIGKYKWINQYRLEILLKNDDKVELFCNENMFKIDSKGDNTYKISSDIKYFKSLFEK